MQSNMLHPVKMKNLFAVLIVCLMVGCQSKGDLSSDRIPLSQSQRIKEINLEMIEISMNDLAGNYFDIYSVLESKDSTMYVGYDRTLHALQFVDFRNFTHTKTLKLEREGPNFIDEIEAIHFFHQDSIFLTTKNFITLLNPSGLVVNRWALKSFKSLANKYVFSGRGNGDLFFDKATKRIYTGIYDITLSEISKPKDYFKGKLFGSINLEESIFEIDSLTYDQAYQMAYFGYLNKPNIWHMAKGKNLISFPILKSFYALDRSRNDFKIYEASAHGNEIEHFTHELNFNQTLQDGVKMKHYMLTTKFSPVIDYNDQLLVRLVRKGLPMSTVDLKDINRKRKVYIIIYDLANRNYQEQELAENFLNADLIFMANGSLFVQGYTTTEGMSKFLKIDFKQPE
ncbi:MAG: hypothetical protein ACJAZV_000195 [Roseivirga sp.]|jgi:hypothetical protein